VTERRPGRISVRAATPGDIHPLIGLLSQLHPEHPANSRTARHVLEAVLQQHGRPALLAQADEEVITTADLLLVPNLTHRARPWAIVENLVVDEAARGQGAGRALIDEIVARAERARCYMIQLLSLNHRTAASAFYRHHGFQPVAQGFRCYLGASARPDTQAPVRGAGDAGRAAEV
jgi:GNAT superfamily N-acetyltransferase